MISAVTAALVGQWLLSRYWERFLNVLIAKPGEKDKLRGRAV